MDELDQKILALLSRNARMPLKDIAERVSLTSPAVSSRIRRLEQEGIIERYTVVLRRPEGQKRVNALISLSTKPTMRRQLIGELEAMPEVLQCYHVTGDHSFLIKVSCEGMNRLEHLITRLQQMGQTNTQIILSTPVDRGDNASAGL